MLNVRFSGQFKKDFKKIKKQGFSNDEEKEFMNIIEDLCKQKPLNEKYHDHPLNGNYNGTREFHLRPDLVVIYKVKDKDLELLMLRMGSHSELF